MNKPKKQTKKLLRIVEKLYKYDLEEILVHFKQSKCGNKQKLKDKVIQLIENDRNDLSGLNKKIRQVYNNNDKIKKKSKKSFHIPEDVQTSDSSNDMWSESINDSSQQTLKQNSNDTMLSQNNQSQDSQQSMQRNLNVANQFSLVNESQRFYNTSHTNSQFIDINVYQRNALSLLNNSSQLPANAAPFMPSVNIQNSFANNRPQQPLNLSINNYFSSSSFNNSKFFAQNYSLNSASNGFRSSSQTLESLIEQQNLLLPQSFQDRDITFNDDYCFKSLPKYKQISKIQEIKIIENLSDIGTVNEFYLTDLNTKLSSFNCYGIDSLSTILRMNSLQIQLRFCYITEVNSREQKDCCPEHLCIDVNGKKLYSYSESEDVSGPFDISSFCKLGPNVVKFWLDKTNFTWILPCAYQISIVTSYTPESFLNTLKQNNMQFLHQDFTKSLIKPKLQQSQDEFSINITITDINIKTKLTCPLSRRRIETPCRTINCKHIECFDGISFFKMNDLKYDWFCPICQTLASFDLLRIDGYFSEILRNTDSSIEEVNFKSDASYETVSKNLANDSVIIELDDTMDEEREDCTILTNNCSDDDCVIID